MKNKHKAYPVIFFFLNGKLFNKKLEYFNDICSWGKLSTFGLRKNNVWT